jgi:hypothetical protein
MIKTATALAISAFASIAGCQPGPQTEVEPTPCIVWAELDQQVDIDPPCELNVIFPGHVSQDECDHMGGHTGQLHDTCYDVDY